MLVITFGYFKGVLKDSVPLHCFKKNMHFPISPYIGIIPYYNIIFSLLGVL